MSNLTNGPKRQKLCRRSLSAVFVELVLKRAETTKFGDKGGRQSLREAQLLSQQSYAIETLEDLLLAEHLKQMIEARANCFAGRGHSNRMNQGAGLDAESGGDLFQGPF